MKQLQSTVDCYNRTSEAYAELFLDELSYKPLDRLLLQRFARENSEKGVMADLGCGPGQTTRFLHDTGVQKIIGIDLAPKMIAVARTLNPASIPFETGNLLRMEYPEEHFGSALAFYAIVHFTTDELSQALAEIFRVIKPGGQFLFCFHVGEGTSHREEFLNQPVNIDFHFFDVDDVVRRTEEAGFTLLDTMIRYPYAGKEYPSKRAYLIAEKRFSGLEY